jgi:SMI1 / KNR4 family (SUKH-1)
MPNWLQLLRVDGYEMRPGARAEAFDATEAVLGLRLPEELWSLYRVSDGVFDTDGQWFVIWPLDMLAEQNLRRRAAGIIPEDFIAFGDDGAGDPFCVERDQSTVSCWHALDDRNQRLAPDVATFWHRWVDGTITT